MDAVNDRIRSQMKALVDNKEHALMRSAAVVDALNPLAVLMRGYSITTLDGKVIISADEVEINDRIRIRLSDGFVNAVAESTEKEYALPRRGSDAAGRIQVFKYGDGTDL